MTTRCFQFTKFAYEKGHQVNIFFIEDGTLWADKTRNFKEKAIPGDCPDDYFPVPPGKRNSHRGLTAVVNARQVHQAKFFPNMLLEVLI